MSSPRRGRDTSRISQELLSPCRRKDKHPLSCHCGTGWEEIPSGQSWGCSLTAPVSTPLGANEAFIYSRGFCLVWRLSEQPEGDREINKGKRYLLIPCSLHSR